MRKLIVLVVALPFLVWAANAGEDTRSRNSTVTMSNDDPSSDDCRDHLRVGDGDHQSVVRDEEAQTVSNQPLTITASRNGGIQVTTWDKPDFSLKLCKQVAADDESQGRKLLSQIHLEINGTSIAVRAPSEDSYSLGTVLLVKAPRGASLKLSVHNGGISLNGFTGTAEAHAQNGGVSFKGSSGKLTAEAQNGGVSIKDCSGEVNASVQNGGLSLTLPERWEGKGLDAHARNGGLVVSVPKSFNGGLEIIANDHTSMICKDTICDAGQRTSEDGRKVFRIGGANPQIRATTDNGGVVIKERERSRAEL
jgi:DUF4097 and DUF4098 domain-containing protein YvlB